MGGGGGLRPDVVRDGNSMGDLIYENPAGVINGQGFVRGSIFGANT
jgi:hypothetical protein